jgi:rhomboid protease GluP
MEMRFTQKHIEQLPLDNLTIEQFLCVAIETSNLLGWDFGNISETGFIAYTKNGLFSWNAEVKLKIKNGLANLQSESRENEIINLGKNKKNLQGFISTFKSLKKTLTPEEIASKYQDLKANFV